MKASTLMMPDNATHMLVRDPDGVHRWKKAPEETEELVAFVRLYVRRHPAAVLELLARSLGARAERTPRDGARICSALVRALREDDHAALEHKSGPDRWARKYLGEPEQRSDRTTTLSKLVSWFEQTTHETNEELAFWVVGLLFILKIDALEPRVECKPDDVLERDVRAELERVRDWKSRTHLARHRAQAVMRAWGWPAKVVDDAFNSVD